jgi:hypothetical protein
MEGVVVKKNGGGGEFKYNIFDTFKNFSKCHNISPPNTTIKKVILRKWRGKRQNN